MIQQRKLLIGLYNKCKIFRNLSDVALVRKNRRWILARHFRGPAKESDFKIQTEDVPELIQGELLTRAMFWSVDPYMRANAHNYKVDEIMPGFQVARVIESKNRMYAVGTVVTGPYGWQTLNVVNPRKIPSPALPVREFGPLPISLALSYAGMTGNAAYFGMMEIARPKKREMVVVSGAGGAVGSHAGQLAKLSGATVVGICGSKKKCEWITDELEFDYAINYKTQDVGKALRKIAKNGVDIYWDNVGGSISSQVINEMNAYGKVIVCGAISTYNSDFNLPPSAPDVQGFISSKQLSIQGFLVNSFSDDWEAGINHNLKLLKGGSLKYKETLHEGFDNIPAAFIAMMNGLNTGKTVVKNTEDVDDQPEAHSGGFFVSTRHLGKDSLNV